MEPKGEAKPHTETRTFTKKETKRITRIGKKGKTEIGKTSWEGRKDIRTLIPQLE